MTRHIARSFTGRDFHPNQRVHVAELVPGDMISWMGEFLIIVAVTPDTVIEHEIAVRVLSPRHGIMTWYYTKHRSYETTLQVVHLV